MQWCARLAPRATRAVAVAPAPGRRTSARAAAALGANPGVTGTMAGRAVGPSLPGSIAREDGHVDKWHDGQGGTASRHAVRGSAPAGGCGSGVVMSLPPEAGGARSDGRLQNAVASRCRAAARPSDERGRSLGRVHNSLASCAHGCEPGLDRSRARRAPCMPQVVHDRLSLLSLPPPRGRCAAVGTSLCPAAAAAPATGG